MSTKKPRITVTLEPRVYEVIHSISENGGESMSRFIASFFEENLPTFERMALTFQKLAREREAGLKKIGEDLEDAERALSPLLADALKQRDLFAERSR